ncbi:hypothetical protein LCGC14_0535220 [marine sediment metagenome]|uniref:Uncharacterized protein n=1 Tax=marine sediment metagenome TaxID=412755 RepID=A0A0F9RZ38_9ZZZZ
MAETLATQIRKQERELAQLQKQRAVLEAKQLQVQKLVDLKEAKQQEIKKIEKTKIPTVAQAQRKRKLQRGLSKTLGFLTKAEKVAVSGGKALIREEKKLVQSKDFKQGIAAFRKGGLAGLFGSKTKRVR